MASNTPACIFCKRTEEEEPGLKSFHLKTWETAKTAARRRMILQNDKFSSTSNDITKTEGPQGKYYHSVCHSRYCAVKRQASPAKELSQLPRKDTRLTSSYPSTNTRGVLGKECLFCGKTRKRKSQKNETLSQCTTTDGSKAIIFAANRKGDGRIIALGEDLIAKEAKYHNSCRRDYVRQPPAEEKQTSNRKIHAAAFHKLSMFLENEVIKNKSPMLMTVVFTLYKEEFLALGGTQDDIDRYSVQPLVSKMKEHFQNELLVDKQAKKSGNIVFPSSMTATEAFAMLTESSEKMENIRCAAMALRTEILAMPKSKTPKSTSVHTLKETSPNIPDLTLMFFRTLIGGLQSEPGLDHASQDAIERKVLASASDAVFNCTRGTVRPWKHQSLGLGLGTLTGSKTVLTIQNRLGHCISYDEVKQLETEIAYTCCEGERETPAGIHLQDGLGTALAWDNYDVNTETPDGKNTLHATVGICYQNEVPSETSEPVPDHPAGTLTGRRRRRFDGPEKVIPPFHTSLKKAQFKLTPSGDVTLRERKKIQQEKLDFIWLLQSFTQTLPLFTGFFSRFVTDYRPQTTIAYMDPIAQPPTRNDVVQETMARSVKVAEETNQGYAVITYDLAVALKAYSIQALQTPTFDKVIIMLGNFHLELAYFGAIGTFLADSGVEYLLTEAGVLAEGSLSGFMKGKFYNRCTRVHQILAAVMERALFTMYLELVGDAEEALAYAVMTDSDSSVEHCQNLTENASFSELMKRYESFFHDVINGKYGSTAAYWAIYVYFINRVYRELQRAVRTNDVDGYIRVLPSVIEVFFALNRPNYARWGCLFLHKLQEMDPKAREILEAGAMSIRRTKKSYARCPVDLTLEQTVNRDAASPLRGITAFTNSHSAFRRWSITLTQRSKALTELRELVSLQPGEEPANQLMKWRVERDNADMNAIANTLNNTCNPFATSSPDDLINVSSGRTAKEATKTFLLGTLERGERLRQKFTDECAVDGSRFLKPVARIKMLNFAAENVKKSKSAVRKMNAVEGVRDVFGRMLAIAAKTSNAFNLQHILSHPVTEVPLSLAHSDGTPLKTDKATLTKLLESRQEVVLVDTTLPAITATVIDGGIILHEIVLQHSKSTYATMARDLLTKVCLNRGQEIHLVFDKYQSPSIKDAERNLRHSATQVFVITGPDQAQRQSGTQLLKNGSFKEEFTRFVMQEWKKPQYGPIIGRKTLYVSHGGMCTKMKNNENDVLQIEEPHHLQSQHEEADTLIAFHANSITTGDILVRSTDTDVFIILLGLCGRSEGITIIMDYGAGNNRRYVNVSELASTLEKKQPGITEAIIGLHALTGCDFTSCFFRKGKVKPFRRMESDPAHVMAMRSLTSEEVDIAAVTSFVCSLYGFKTSDIDEARYKAFMRMSGGSEKEPLARIKKINCASLPPCSKTCSNHIKRANYVARIWKRADQIDPTGGSSPTDCGWKLAQNCFEPDWYPGNAVPESLTGLPSNGEERVEETSTDEESDVESAWSEESDENDDSDGGDM